LDVESASRVEVAGTDAQNEIARGIRESAAQAPGRFTLTPHILKDGRPQHTKVA
jgi:hypothetical protein